jgi:hypothetical protein
MKDAMTREQRRSYAGPVEIWVDGIKRFDVEARLAGYVEILETATASGLEHVDGETSWGGQLEGLSHHNQLELIGPKLELRFPSEQRSEALMDNSGAVRGLGETPF